LKCVGIAPVASDSQTRWDVVAASEQEETNKHSHQTSQKAALLSGEPKKDTWLGKPPMLSVSFASHVIN
jgi:hypothetical protein